MTSMSLVLVVLWLILEFSGYKSKKHIKLDMTYSARLVKKFRFQISKRSLVMLEKTRNLETLILKNVAVLPALLETLSPTQQRKADTGFFPGNETAVKVGDFIRISFNLSV